MNKKTGIIALIIAVVVGGGALAFAFLGGSTKQDYFKAEFKSVQTMVDDFKDRYKPELDYYDMTMEHPVEATSKMTVDMNSQSALLADVPTDLIKDSHIEMTSQSDMKNNVADVRVKGEVAGMPLDNIYLRLAQHDLFVQLPFLSEVLTINDKKVNELMKENDPEWTEEMSIDFTQFFNQNTLPADKDMKHVQDAMLKTLYKNLDDEAFTSTKEKVTVLSEELNAEKITMDLGPEQLKKATVAILELVRDDKTIQKMVKESMTQNAMFEMTSPEEMMKDFNNDINEAIEEVKQSTEKPHLVSTIWIADDFIVKRELTMADDEETAVQVKGDHLRKKDGHTFQYAFGSVEQPNAFTIQGETKFDGKITADRIDFAVEDLGTLTYTADETLEKDVRDYKYTFSVQSDMAIAGELVWSGKNEYSKDAMKSSQRVGINYEDIKVEDVALIVESDTKRIKATSENPTDNIRNLNDMSQDEITTYLETEFEEVGQILQGLLMTTMFDGDMEGAWDEEPTMEFTDADFEEMRAELAEDGIEMTDEEFAEWKLEMQEMFGNE